MPQLDISTYSSQLFWLFVTFFTFLFVCNFFIVPNFRKNIDGRNEHISKELEISESNRFKATEILSSVNKRFESVKSEINDKTRDEKNRLFKEFIDARDAVRNDVKSRLKSSLQDIKKSSSKLDTVVSDDFVNDLVSLLELKYKK